MRALIIRHDHPSNAGFVGERLAERGFVPHEVTVVPEERFHSPDVRVDFPRPDDYDVVVSLGAPWSVYDTAAIGTWIDDELTLLREAFKADVPVLGICFGAQALAAALGGTVERAPSFEIGRHEVDSDDPALIAPGPWYQWHFDRFTVPPGAREIARSAAGPQAYVVGRSLGVQFHPEVTPEIMTAWLENGGDTQAEELGLDVAALRLPLPGARERAHALVDAFLADVAKL
ncbi:glutamine amidotransferase-related protein [Embleya sp. NBC_00896]|uniref:type 1 glutamine amidotransferase n=1 Tax=Embleya sp. NBC_00896 TaxID=2975961 RepID=UPI002F918A9E|nr:gamma-glutamyl-gamma-aminobutyrate hydrolase family protein [Embleya sp. NBC_00896]